jgi:hypothetical protein
MLKAKYENKAHEAIETKAKEAAEKAAKPSKVKGKSAKPR